MIDSCLFSAFFLPKTEHYGIGSMLLSVWQLRLMGIVVYGAAELTKPTYLLSNSN